MRPKYVHPDTQLLCYTGHLRYIFNCTLSKSLIFVNVSFDKLYIGYIGLTYHFGKDNYLTVSKLQTSCFYHKYFKNYKLLNMTTTNKMLNMVRTIPFCKSSMYYNLQTSF